MKSNRDTEQQNKKPRKLPFESAQILLERWQEGTFSEIIDDWRWIFRYSARYKGAIAFYIILGLVSTSLGLVSSIAGKYLIDIITGYKTDRLVELIVIMAGSGIFSLVFDNIVNRISTRLSVDINNDIQADIFDQIIDADWQALSQFRNGDILNRFNGDVNTVSSNAISWLPNIIIALYRFAATFLVIFHYDWIMALIALASAPFLILISRLVIKKQREYAKKVRQISSDLMTFESETIYNFDTIKSFGAADQYSGRLRGWQAGYKDLVMRYNLFSIRTNVAMNLSAMLVGFAAFGYCLYRLWSRKITFGTMTLFMQQTNNLSNAFNSLISIVPTFLNSSVSAHRIRELVELPREIHLPESQIFTERKDQGIRICLEEVSFAYGLAGSGVSDQKLMDPDSSGQELAGSDTSGQEWVDSGVSDHGSGSESEAGPVSTMAAGSAAKKDYVLERTWFRAGPGEIIALVGPSGGGKTTMLRLMLGLIHPSSGSVLLIGDDGQIVPANADTRQLIAYVPQGNTLLSGTIADNLQMAKEEASKEEMIRALQIACAWDFIEKLPYGIKTPVGERGKGFSEGQAQRIAIARALLRDAPVLLFDEATSSLDEETERRVLQNIIENYPCKTCIITTHRPSVLTICHKIYRITDRVIKEY